MNNIPIIRLQFEGMRHEIVHALLDYNDEIMQAIQEEIDRQIKAFNLTTYIREEVHRCLQEMVSGSLKRHISYTLKEEIANEVEGILAERLNNKGAISA